MYSNSSGSVSSMQPVSTYSGSGTVLKIEISVHCDCCLESQGSCLCKQKVLSNRFSMNYELHRKWERGEI